MPLERGTRIAIVDDDRHAAEVTSELLAEIGLRPTVLEQDFDEVAGLVDAVRDAAPAAVIDHRLSTYGKAPFDGATAVAALFDVRWPAVLLTQYVMDADTSIRRWRAKIPVVLTRDNADGAAVERAVDVCRDEFQGKFSPIRRPRRTLVRIEGRTREGDFEVADALIPGWNPGRAVRFPIDVIEDPALRDEVAPGVRFFAYVNVGSRSYEDVYLASFELAPPLDPEDGLA